MKTIIRPALIGAATLVLALVAGAASARELPGFTITKAHSEETRHFTGPDTARPSLAVGDWTFDECKTATWCDAFPIAFDAGKANGHRTLLRMEWPTSADYEPRFFTADGKTSLATLSNVQEPGNNKKIKQTLYVDLQKGDYAMAIACYVDPCNQGYSFTVRIIYEKGYVPPSDDESPQPTVAPSPTSTDTPGEEASDEPSPDPVATAGADGPGQSRVIDGLAVSQQAKPPSNRMTSITNLVLVILLALVLGGGGITVAVRIRRDLRG